MTLLDSILAAEISDRPAEKANWNPSREMEGPNGYPGWAPGIRSLLALRYLKYKRQALTEFHCESRYAISGEELVSRIRMRLDQSGVKECSKRALSLSLCSLFFRRRIFYVVVLIATLTMVSGVFREIDNHRIESVFTQALPRYTELMHTLRKKQINLESTSRTLDDRALPGLTDDRLADEIELARATLKQLMQSLEKVKAGILESLPEDNGIRLQMNNLLIALQGEKLIAKPDLGERAELLNQALYRSNIPFYLAVRNHTVPCDAILADTVPEMAAAVSVTSSISNCDVTVVLTYTVESVRHYRAEGRKHRVFFTRRLDQIDTDEAAFGLLYDTANSAQVLVGTINSHIGHRIRPLEPGARHHRMMPLGLPDMYGLEPIADRLLEDSISDLIALDQSHYYAWDIFLKDAEKPSQTSEQDFVVLLESAFTESVAFHEVQHLVNRHHSFSQLTWTDTVLAKIDHPEFRDHVIDELSAYLLQFTNAQHIGGVLLTQVTTIALDPLLEDVPHHYAARILLAGFMDQVLKPEQFRPRQLETLADIADAYRQLAKNSNQLKRIAPQVFQRLFGRQMPVIRVMK